MKRPSLVLRSLDDWAEQQLQPLAETQQWKLVNLQRLPAWAGAFDPFEPMVGLLQTNLTDDHGADIAALVEVAKRCPMLPVVVLSDVKLPEDDRVLWTALLLDCGASLVLYPPLTRAMLEEAALGLMQERLGTLRLTTPIDLAMEPVE
jgi:hypothetical protein